VATYLITGGAGFIGSHLAEELLRQGANVRVLDDFSTGKRRNLEHLHSLDLLEGDVGDLGTCRGAMAGVDYVLHQAAVASVPRSVEDPLATNQTNVTGTLNVLIAARDARVRRVVFAGSSAIYGNGPQSPKREDLAPEPISPYAVQKLAAEQYCRAFHQLYGLETVTTRYFNVFGPRQDPGSPYSGVISLFAAAILEGRSPVIHGDGEQTRDFTYVANVVDGVLRACHTPAAAGQVFNLATGTSASLNELLLMMGRLSGAAVLPTYGPPRDGDVRHSAADISRASAALDYTPRVSLEKGLAETLTWFRAERVLR